MRDAKNRDAVLLRNWGRGSVLRRSGAAVVWHPMPKAVARGRPTRQQLLARFMLCFFFNYMYFAPPKGTAVGPTNPMYAQQDANKTMER